MRIFIAMMASLFIIFNHSVHAAQRNLAVTKSTGEQKRLALVIGNAAYQSSPLKNPVNDAKAMSDALNGLGFQVIEVTDATQKEMNQAIAAFGEKLNSETAALFFYAGHGLQVKGKNYLVPVDALIKTESAVGAESVSMDIVMDQLNVSSLSVVILDACRNNPFERSFRKMGGGGLAQMEAPKGSFIAYATAPGKTASDGDGKNGLFTQEILKQISTVGLPLEEVFKRVRANVLKATNDVQMPWDSSSLTGSFYFKPGDATQVANIVPVPVQPAHIKSKEEIEDDTWNSADASNSIDAINAYLSGYPKGRYVTQAKVKLAALKAETNNKPQPAPVQSATGGREDVETILWSEAQKGNSREDYQAYLDQYPRGKYVALANSRIKKLQSDAQAAADKQEQEAWEAAQQTNSEASYMQYLKNYPDGRYTGLARARQEKIKKDNWGPEWIADAKGCHAHNAHPKPNESVSWTGICVNGYMSGKGTLTWYQNGKENETQTGSFEKGKMTGKGISKFSNGNRYEGDFVDDKMTGKGIRKYDNGTYEGDFVDGKRTGKGIYIFSDGGRYEGDWVDDKMSGKGIYKYASGDSYEGDWVDDKMSGKGIYKYASGGRYEGDWVDDKMSGKGIYKYANGDSYDGQFANDLPNGYGVLRFADGRVVNGQWSNGCEYKSRSYALTPRASCGF